MGDLIDLCCLYRVITINEDFQLRGNENWFSPSSQRHSDGNDRPFPWNREVFRPDLLDIKYHFARGVWKLV